MIVPWSSKYKHFHIKNRPQYFMAFLKVVNDHGVQGDIYDLGSSQQNKVIFKSDPRIFTSLCTAQVWDLEDRQPLGFAKSDPSPKNTQSKPVLGNANKDTIGEGTPMKKGAVVVTKHLKRRKSDLTADKPVEALGTLKKKKERGSLPIQRLPFDSRTLYHGRTWLKVGPGEFSN